MECNYCTTQFTHSTHTPRLLIFCGHSLCEQCCRQLHQNSPIQCPECFSNTFIEDINFLPKNLALLKVNSSSAETTCLKHEKKYEGTPIAIQHFAKSKRCCSASTASYRTGTAPTK